MFYIAAKFCSPMQPIPPDYAEINRHQWNERTKVHLRSAFYDMTSFLEGRNSLTSIERQLLGELAGLSVLHLQCHFGQDSLSMARMGAKVTGLDLSDEAIRQASQINHQLGLSARFICGDVLSMDEYLQGETFDIIFTSFGVIGWLPSLEKWGKLISNHLKPGGKFILAEFHPAVWMFDDHFTHVAYAYFNRETIREEGVGTYTDGGEDLKLTSVSWNHSLAEVFTALLGAGLQVVSFDEYDYSPFDCFSQTSPAPDGGYYIKGMEGKLPLFYTLVCTKP
jgi:2-polyprenyl-3-methyl-5-hydroxy-6-metoxy-1,4-benzoquinol methylase